MKVGAIILSGGKSSRFGSDKGLFKFKNKALIQHSIDICKSFTNDIIIISNKAEYKQFGYPIFSDIFPESGPMGGIHSGLNYTKNDINIILSADTPFINIDLIKMLLNEYTQEDILITKSADGKYQTLIGIYHKRVLDILKNELSEKHLKMIHLIKQLNSKIIPIPKNSPLEESFINFNHLAELRSYEH